LLVGELATGELLCVPASGKEALLLLFRDPCPRARAPRLWDAAV